jgi:murein DD-endopeptidase MepM/ murein hydrolase activator NlpD
MTDLTHHRLRGFGPARVLLAALALTLCLGAADAVSADAKKKRKFAYGTRVMKMGTRGKDVRVLQKFLAKLGVTVSSNGVFAKPTRGAVKKLEKRQGWKVDGIVPRGQAAKIRRLVEARNASGFYFFGLIQPTVTVTAASAGKVSVAVRDERGNPVTSWPLNFQSPGSQTISWNGRNAPAGGGAAADGTYDFYIHDQGTANASLSGNTQPFAFHNHQFPISASHNFGGAGSRFGASRGGRSHQGQDVAAACGSKLDAAQGGTVRVTAYQASGAGYYVVIRGAGTGEDYVYMHLRSAASVGVGSTVYTGQQIGYVGSTGSSTGCHLHFERWTIPGWYLGGSPYDPLPSLLSWDAYS